MNLKRITIIQIIITVVLMFVLYFVFDYKVSLGILLGSSLGYLNFYFLSRKINNISDEEIPNMNKIIKDNRNFRYLLLILVLIISGFLPMIFNLIAVCFSILICKISMHLDLMFFKK